MKRSNFMKRSVNILTLALATLFTATPSLAATESITKENKAKVVVAKNMKWGYLNPQRGELSPGAVDLWGDRTIDTATGMLVRFNKGFESPPHIHNITYRGIVIEGLMHNDDPTSAKMWMPTGSFWTQPAGEDHTTAANADTNLIYLEIDKGPYLVQPSKDSFDNGERPLNLHRDNIVWLTSTDLHDIKAKGVEFTQVWGSTGDMGGSMIKLPVGFKGEIITKANEFRAVLITGEIDYKTKNEEKPQALTPGSYVESKGYIKHKIANTGKTEATLYIRTNDRYKVK